MTRNEAIAKGIEVDATIHSMKRRSPWHDYHHKGTYMLTLVVEGRRPLFGKLVPLGETKGTVASVPAPVPSASPSSASVASASPSSAPVASASPSSAPVPSASPSSASVPSVSPSLASVPSAFPEGVTPHVALSPLGRAIAEEEIQKISRLYPMVEVWKLCLMPDHLHMIVRVKADLPSGKTLGTIVRGFKTGCTRAWWRLAFPAPAAPSSPASVPSAFPEGSKPLLFEPGYNDKILLREGQLDNWKAYLDDNPRRLWLKRQHPHLFTVLHDMPIAGCKCQIVGNRFLLDIPDKVAVIVHRRYTDDENARLRSEWLACGERGGVLVSAAIAPKEKAVLREAMDLGYRIILLRENGFPELYKPTGESFDACSAGLLLQVSPWAFHMDRTTISRAQCLELNALAERIAAL